MAKQILNTIQSLKSKPHYAHEENVYLPGAVIFAEGDARDHAYIVEDGAVEITIMKDGAPVTVAKLGPGEIFGETALMERGGTRSATATATAETRVFVITRDLIMERVTGLDPLIGLLMSLLIDRYKRSRALESGVSADGEDPKEHVSEKMEAFLEHWAVQKESALKELQMAREIKEAIAAKQFVPHIQPIVTIPGRKLEGFEALVRWEHPEKGMIPPFEFVPVAERTNVVRELDLMMLRRVCEHLPGLRETAGHDLFVSVNLSGTHFTNHNVVDVVREILDEHKVDPASIKLEITESALVTEPELAIDILRDLKRIGVSIALDDFGTGYSSLSYLHKFSIDTIKVDRSFVRQVDADKRGLDIVRAIVGLARTFDLGIIAEGIENENEIGALTGAGCEAGQGYFFGKPMPVADAAAWIAENARLAG